LQAQILELLDELRRDLGLAVLLITHDLGVVAEICDRVVVMRDGQVVETAGVEELFQSPADPYTRELLAALPRLEGAPSALSWRFRASARSIRCGAACFRAGGVPCGPSTASTWNWPAANAWPWWGSRGAARRRSAAAPCGWSSPRPAGSSSTARTSSPCPPP